MTTDEYVIASYKISDCFVLYTTVYYILTRIITNSKFGDKFRRLANMNYHRYFNSITLDKAMDQSRVRMSGSTREKERITARG